MTDESGAEEPAATGHGATDSAAASPGSDPGEVADPESAEVADVDPAGDGGVDSTSTPDPDAGDDRIAPGLSDDGVLLFFAGLACLLAATTAYNAGQPQAITVFAVLAGLPAAAAFVGDVLSEFVPGTGLELLVGGSALVGALFAVPGRYYVNIATLLVAATLVLWRVVDVEFRDAER